jgi:hypothetical protein
VALTAVVASTLTDVAAGQTAPAATAAPPAAAKDGGPMDFTLVVAAAQKHFASIKDLQPSDLLSQGQVSAALDAVRNVGWEVAERDAILDRTLPDGSFLVKELATPAGRKFMRRLSRHRGAYSRLDRLSSIAGGQQIIHDLARQKNGDKLIEYLATTEGGQSLGRMAAGARQGVNLNKPTGRIYTADDLLVALETAFRDEQGKNFQIAK